MEWLKIVIAAGFEVGWVIGLKYATTILEWGFTLVAIGISFYLLIEAGNHLPAGTAYAVFVGLGTVGTVLMDMWFFDESFQVGKLFFVFLLLIGILVLKSATIEEEEV